MYILSAFANLVNRIVLPFFVISPDSPVSPLLQPSIQLKLSPVLQHATVGYLYVMCSKFLISELFMGQKTLLGDMVISDSLLCFVYLFWFLLVPEVGQGPSGRCSSPQSGATAG